jgi:hypothetical protein
MSFYVWVLSARRLHSAVNKEYIAAVQQTIGKENG